MARNHANVFSRKSRDGSPLDPKNGRMLEPHLRGAQVGRLRATRSNHQRCPRCKKLRMKWMPANNWHEWRQRWQHYNKQLVCWLCVYRLREAGERMDEELVETKSG